MNDNVRQKRMSIVAPKGHIVKGAVRRFKNKGLGTADGKAA